MNKYNTLVKIKEKILTLNNQNYSENCKEHTENNTS